MRGVEKILLVLINAVLVLNSRVRGGTGEAALLGTRLELAVADAAKAFRTEGPLELWRVPLRRAPFLDGNEQAIARLANHFRSDQPHTAVISSTPLLVRAGLIFDLQGDVR